MPVARQVFDLAADDTEDGSELHDGWMTSTRSVRRPLSQVGQNPDTRSRLSMSPSLALPTRPLACRLHPLLGDVRSVILTATTWLAPLGLAADALRLTSTWPRGPPKGSPAAALGCSSLTGLVVLSLLNLRLKLHVAGRRRKE